MKQIYEPKGAAKEYGDYAINIYTGCPHGCFYCFAPSDVLNLIDLADYVNLWKVGKLNYHSSDIDWKEFGERAECWLRDKKRNRLDFDYYIKESLRAEMEENR